MELRRGFWIVVGGATLALGCSSRTKSSNPENPCGAGEQQVCVGGECRCEPLGGGGSGGGQAGDGGMNPGSGGSASGMGGQPSAGSAGQGGTGAGSSGASGSGGSGGAASGSLYLLWMVNAGKAAVVELDRQTGDEIATLTYETPYGTGEARDLGVHPDGRLRLLWNFGAPTAQLWALDGAAFTVEREYTYEDSLLYAVYARNTDTYGRLLIQQIDAVHVYRTSEDSIVGLSMAHPLLSQTTEYPTDYSFHPGGARLSISYDDTTQVRFLDGLDNATGETIECTHPGFAAIAYAVTSDGVVWTGYTTGQTVHVCAHASEAAVTCDPSQLSDGWGPGACRSYTYPDPAYYPADLAVPP